MIASSCQFRGLTRLDVKRSLGVPNSLPRLAALCLLLSWGVSALPQPEIASSPPVHNPGTPASASRKDFTASSAASRFRITGIVINSSTRSPVAGAELSVVAMNARRAGGRRSGAFGQSLSGSTDPSGRFDIEVPSAGGWSITASAHGYHTQALDEHDGYSTAVVLTEAAPVFDIVFQLPPGSTIEGYVVDEAGEPVRNGQVTLSLIPPATPDDDHPRHQVRGTQRTDDRGYYKFSGLIAADYEIRLQAQPWYASTGVGQRFGGSGIAATAGGIGADGAASSAPAPPDPLDVVYPVVWFPGVTDFAAASPLALRPGEIREADFRLSPLPGFHLHLEAPARSDENRRSALQGGGYLTQILSDGTEVPVANSTQTDAQGNTEFSGLAPGTYQIHRLGEANTRSSSSVIQIAPNSTRTLDLDQATPATSVTIKVDQAADVPSLQVTFRDVNSGRTTFAQSSRSGGIQGRGRRVTGSDAGAGSGKVAPNDPSSDRHSERSISLLPGRYEVTLGGINDLHLTGIEATGATAIGRSVTIGGGAPTLTLHVAAGRSNLTGFVHLDGLADAGSMVLLVPATLGDPAGLGVSRRDQSNTDGSFDILNVLPGRYILIAVDHGWDLNWRDPATLQRFLIHGTALDLSAPGDSKLTVEAQSP